MVKAMQPKSCRAVAAIEEFVCRLCQRTASRWREMCVGGTVRRWQGERSTPTPLFGAKLVVRKWNSRIGQWAWANAGRDYHERNRQRFVVNIACFGDIPPARPAGAGRAMCSSAAPFYGHHYRERIVELSDVALAH